MTDRVARLRRLDTCSVSDACDRLGFDDPVTLVARPLTGATCIAGRVITVELGPASGGTPSRHLCAAAADAADSDAVIVIAHQGRTDSAGWGGNLSRAARQRGAAGTIIHGAARDIDESIAIGYPVFASSATPRTARGRTQEVTWAASIEFDGITVDHGDFVIADSTGIVFVPSARVDEVIEAAEAIAAKEAVMAERIDAGRPVAEVMGADYEGMLDGD